jgi:hypothetical protein
MPAPTAGMSVAMNLERVMGLQLCPRRNYIDRCCIGTDAPRSGWLTFRRAGLGEASRNAKLVTVIRSSSVHGALLRRALAAPGRKRSLENVLRRSERGGSSYCGARGN